MSKIVEKDSVVHFISASCASVSAIKRVWLFGSRANKKHTEKSDYDLAFEVNLNEKIEWGDFCSLLREQNPSLNQLDLVRIDQIEKDFVEKIQKEGVKIYERL